MADPFSDVPLDDIAEWRSAVVRARNKTEWWLKNHGQSDSKFSEVEKAQRRRDKRSLQKLENHLTAAENRARTGGARTRQRGSESRGD